ncbi:hypothetical protein BQ8420_12060 [Nocardiopsis sp. JB363]|nr:hypothetical protein BQ8420_12060 [Nocardiopsis sp. JB363]
MPSLGPLPGGVLPGYVGGRRLFRGALRAFVPWSVVGARSSPVVTLSRHAGAGVPLRGASLVGGRLPIGFRTPRGLRPLLPCGHRSGRDHFAWHAYLPRIRPVEPTVQGSAASGTRACHQGQSPTWPPRSPLPPV